LIDNLYYVSESEFIGEIERRVLELSQEIEAPITLIPVHEMNQNAPYDREFQTSGGQAG